MRRGASRNLEESAHADSSFSFFRTAGRCGDSGRDVVMGGQHQVAVPSLFSSGILALMGVDTLLESVPFWAAAGVLAALVGVTLAAVLAAANAYAQPTPTHVAESYAGREAVAVTSLAPAGYVLIDGERWSARSLGGPVAQGDCVTIIRQRGLRLDVLPATATPLGDASEPQSLPPP
jgi:membrane protein implicated in regulation of membrane protease activity